MYNLNDYLDNEKKTTSTMEHFFSILALVHFSWYSTVAERPKKKIVSGYCTKWELEKSLSALDPRRNKIFSFLATVLLWCMNYKFNRARPSPIFFLVIVLYILCCIGLEKIQSVLEPHRKKSIFVSGQYIATQESAVASIWRIQWSTA